ncbi:unnamed protein product [marine sediment metagenome]|uniref:Holin n=1 Tax=marine sediment metagenome TaxID=412755 RepID=X0T4X9_9ZZZZ
MDEITRQLVSGVLAGAIASATAVVTLLQDTALIEVSDGQWTTIFLGGFLAAAAGWRTLLAQPPRS